uniref:Ig-like domain-containing protein n=1 Tax=Magallana gigas TaxID=29159 RepID=A0A8W8MC94_MAGGI
MIYAEISIHLKTCKDDPYPSFRCQIIDGTNTIDSSEEVQLEITGNPKYIDSPSIIFPLTSKAFELGEVLQLQCTGEKDFRTQTDTDIRWCKSVSGQYQVISLQDTPQTQIVSQREDGCTYVQKSEIFYHITEEDNDLDIMCELEYIKNSKICGKGRFNSTLRISTHLKGDGWTLSPIMIYNEDSMLNSQNITLEGIGNTVQLICVGSNTNQTDSIMEGMMWCIRKTNNTEWTPIVLQENKLETVINSSGKIRIYSKVTYHLIGLEKSIDIMCQISSSPKCGSGVISSNVSLQINPSESEGQYYLKQREIVEPERTEAWLAVTLIISVTLLVVILVLATVLLKRAHRKGGLSLFGFVIKRESKQIVTGPNENYTNTEFNRDHSPEEISRDIYQIQHSSSTANGSGNTYEMHLNPDKQPTYEEITKNAGRKEEYENLSF